MLVFAGAQMVDPELSSFLAHLEAPVTPQLYCLPWFLTLFTQAVDVQDVLPLWCVALRCVALRFVALRFVALRCVARAPPRLLRVRACWMSCMLHRSPVATLRRHAVHDVHL